MPVLRIEHSVPSYESWKAAFDSDPVNRKQSGVTRYHILRSLDDPNHVMIDLEFNTKSEAEALLAAMQRIWANIQGSVIFTPKARIVEVVESVDL